MEISCILHYKFSFMLCYGASISDEEERRRVKFFQTELQKKKTYIESDGHLSDDEMMVSASWCLMSLLS